MISRMESAGPLPVTDLLDVQRDPSSRRPRTFLRPRPPGSDRPIPSYRLIDSAGSELGIIEDPRATIELGETVALPEGGEAEVIDVYDDPEHGREGGVNATLALDVE